ncbi:MAG: hypothetical protein KME32_27260 [Mojavia pulchra JT2-VF2]|jgi:glucan phosphoethanolaminetransferase (alkaline phosphatase superfamily)|uniref:Uncharacterized protein n=1 Tax=Mojavia pulchra JT2-VF2 TaxID=287848 RepID=A0A951Q3S1_9NOST|nr:hypothetical protein [Mojavia pulchra JT2-VF2]
MNRTLIAILTFFFLFLFIVSPFAALASLMLVVLSAAFLSLVGNVFQTLIGGNSNSK